MSDLLDKVIAEIHALPEQDQEVIAALILEELASERRWQQLFADSQDFLDQLADEALAEHRAGKTRAIDPDHQFAFMILNRALTNPTPDLDMSANCVIYRRLDYGQRNAHLQPPANQDDQEYQR